MIKVGLIGWGSIGNVHGRAYQALPDAKVVAVADVEPDRRAKAAEFFGATPYASAEELISNADVDMVDICLPTYLHAKYAVQALDKGLHVISEKPMALTPEQCDEMIAAEKRSGKMLMIAHCVRFWPEYHYLKSVYDSGEFGKLQLLSMTRVGAKTMSSWKNWMLDPDLSGGQTVDRHIHDTDFILYLLGVPAAVRTTGAFDDAGLSHVNTHYVYPDGPAVLQGGNACLWAILRELYRAVFDKACIDYNSRRDPKLLVYPWDGKPYEPEYEVSFSGEADTAENGANISALGAYWAEIRYFLDCIKAGRKPEVITPEQGKQTLKVVWAEVESATKGDAVAL